LFAVAQVKVDRMAPAPKVARDSKFARIAFGSNSAQVQRSAAMHSLRCPWMRTLIRVPAPRA
jgi:hypothetical protein